MKSKYLILGAGPTGLAAACRLKELGEDFLILEGSGVSTGLCRSYKTPEGFIFDTAGHIVFSKRPRYYEFLESLGVKMKKHKRNTYIWLYDKWVPYPLQNNIGYFPTDKAVDALLDLALIGADKRVDRGVDRSTFGKYLLSAFGTTLCRDFLLPYNSKVWSTHPSMMSTSWMGDRVSTVDFRSAMSAALEKKVIDDWGPNNIFYYPEKGGFEDIFKKMESSLGEGKIHYNQLVTQVFPDSRQVLTVSGEKYDYDILISTIPLDYLMNNLIQENGANYPDMIRRSKDLRHNEVVGVGIGYKPNKFNPELESRQPVCWLYFPQPEIPFYRATQLSNYSKASAPEGTRSWLIEMSFEAGVSKEVIQQRVDSVIPSLKSIGLLFDEDEILCFDWHHHSYGYPVPTLERDSVLKAVLPRLESMGIYCRGRHGNWRYENGNSDHAVLQGLEVVDRLVQHKTEEVFNSSY